MRASIVTPDAPPDPRAPTQPAARATQPFAWQGWRLRVPRSWNAVRLEGNFAKGYALLADLDGPRVGLRWSAVKAKDFSPDVLRSIIRAEAGDRAAQRARPLPDPDQPDDGADHLVYLDPDPPGRDVHVWWGAERLLQVVYHAPRRDDVLLGEIIPSLSDGSLRSMRPWAVFDLTCAAPKAFTLISHRLNVGDLSLEFADGKRFVSVRQIALAEMALRRTPLAHWLAQQQRAGYRATTDPSPIDLTLRAGRSISGLIGRARRRLRFRTGERVTLALRDEARDRLIFIDASDESLARDVAQTVGCDLD
jgi:hypothetical protein